MGDDVMELSRDALPFLAACLARVWALATASVSAA